MPQKFYSVVRGKGNFTGVVETWEACKNLVHRVPHVKYKSFKTLAEAEQFIVEKSCAKTGKKKRKVSDSGFGFGSGSGSVDARSPKRRRFVNVSGKHSCTDSDGKGKTDNGDGFEIVYTDGACSNNQNQEKSLAGYGVFFGVDDERNISKPLKGKEQTNNRAEMTAILCVLQHYMDLLKSNPDPDEKKPKGVTVKTDSAYSIKGLTKWIVKWKRNNWKTAANKPVKNQDLWKLMDERLCALQSQNFKVNFVHVKGHSGEAGNEAADRLAVAGSCMHKYLPRENIFV
eukprot:g4509.t1